MKFSSGVVVNWRGYYSFRAAVRGIVLQQHEIKEKNYSKNFEKEKIENIYSAAINNRRTTTIAH